MRQESEKKSLFLLSPQLRATAITSERGITLCDVYPFVHFPTSDGAPTIKARTI